jgi:glycosyltransferase involved in cell wall biosynthesis
MTETGTGALTTTPALRVLVVGASSSRICGVRDYARVTSDAMRDHGATVSHYWWERDGSAGARSTVGGAGRFFAGLREAIHQDRPDVVLWHYSVFTWGRHGIPFLAPRMARELRRSGLPAAAVLHEFAFPIGEGGARGTIWALAHRAVLRRVWRALVCVIVTTEEREGWLQSRRWLARRPTRFLPVCSGLPAPRQVVDAGVGRTVGIFGFTVDESLVDEAIAALVRLRQGGIADRLVLIGAPGARSSAGDMWRKVAARRAFERVEFTGVLEPDELSATLASVDVVLFLDRSGPTSRKTTLAAALATGSPVVATDGPRRWQRLVDERAVLVTQPNARDLAAALQTLLADETARRSQGWGGARFYGRWMAADRLAVETLSFLTQTMAGIGSSRELPSRQETVTA